MPWLRELLFLQNVPRERICLELLVEDGLVDAERVSDLMAKGDEILAMTVSSLRTARANREK